MDILLSSGELPAPATLAEVDYEAMISCLRTALNESTTLRQTERQESLDYYTAWVHQIKTPVSVMKMILESEDTEEHRELLAELFRIEQYVEMVLSYLRLGSSTSDYVFAEYDLDPIIRQAIRKYAPQFIRRKLRLVYTPTDVSVLTDEKWLLFIIEQVLSNSIKYTPAGGSVTISIVDGGVLRISDTGIGISPEDLPRIFEKGFTGYNGRADKKSTGLGLYLCRTAASRLFPHDYSHLCSRTGNCDHPGSEKRTPANGVIAHLTKMSQETAGMSPDSMEKPVVFCYSVSEVREHLQKLLFQM